jgi:hypothetical protein
VQTQAAPFSLWKDTDLRKIKKQFHIGGSQSTAAMAKRPYTQENSKQLKQGMGKASPSRVPKGLNSKERHLEITKFRHQKILFASTNSVEGVCQNRQKDKIESIFNH